MAAKTTISINEFLELPSETAQGVHYELDEGELIRWSPAGKTHAAIVLRVGSYLDQLLPGVPTGYLPGSTERRKNIGFT